MKGPAAGLPTDWTAFENIWVADFEFHAPDGECPLPICAVAYNLRTGRRLVLFEDELARPDPPYGVGPADLFVA